MADLAAVLGVKERGRKLALPSRQDGLEERRLAPGFLAIVRERRFVARDEAAHQNQIAIAV
jgi:hypothetical protein